MALDDTKLVEYSKFCLVGSISPGKADILKLFIVLSTIYSCILSYNYVSIIKLPVGLVDMGNFIFSIVIDIIWLMYVYCNKALFIVKILLFITKLFFAIFIVLTVVLFIVANCTLISFGNFIFIIESDSKWFVCLISNLILVYSYTLFLLIIVTLASFISSGSLILSILNSP